MTGLVIAIFVLSPLAVSLPPKMYPASRRKPPLPARSNDPSTSVSATT
jgi:hypothetical protein